MDATCIRQVTNWSSVKPHHRFESPQFNPEALRDEMAMASPKMKALFDTIERLDRQDQKMEKRLFKHVIFSDLTHGYGAKIITSSCIALGFRLIYDSNLRWVPESERVPFYNFALLASSQIFNTSYPISLRRKIIDTFNRRPENSHGEQLRVIVLDSGYKEGIDLFDVKYIHLFEPAVSAADEKQIIGRGTRHCGQKGLPFHPTLGWPIHVFRYELQIPPSLQPMLGGETSMFPLYLKYADLDLRKITFSRELERVTIESAVDYALNKAVHRFGISESEKDIEYIKGLMRSFLYTFDPTRYPRLHRPSTVRVPSVSASPSGASTRMSESTSARMSESASASTSARMSGGRNPRAVRVSATRPKIDETRVPPAPSSYYSFTEMSSFIQTHFKAFRWSDIQMENQCLDDESLMAETAGNVNEPTVVEFTPTQNFMRSYFQPTSVYKGVLAWHSVGTGKTCMAIATATTRFEREGYTILWVTRHTLKPDIWKNMYDRVCSVSLRDKLRSGSAKDRWTLPVQRPMDSLGSAWIPPISYKQFTNFLNRKNKLYAQMVKRNGEADPLRKTLVIIDEAHKLYTTDIPVQERPDVERLKQMIHQSYEVSGTDSVRVLLMSATPYTTEPMNLVKLLNLLMPVSKNIPDTFETFAETYLDSGGMFTVDGLRAYRDAITGYVSYLNRERDARQFAYPIVEDVVVPLSENKAKKVKQTIVQLEKDIIILEKRKDELKRMVQTLPRKIKEDEAEYIAKVCPLKPRQIETCKTYAQQKSNALYGRLMGEWVAEQTHIAKTVVAHRSKLEYLKKQFKYLDETDISQERILQERCGFKPIRSRPTPVPVPSASPESVAVAITETETEPEPEPSVTAPVSSQSAMPMTSVVKNEFVSMKESEYPFNTTDATTRVPTTRVPTTRSMVSMSPEIGETVEGEAKSGGRKLNKRSSKR